MTSHLNNVPWTLYPNGTVKQFGIDYGETKNKPLKILAQNDKFVVIKFPGSMCWSGIGMPWTYYKGRIAVFQIDSKLDNKYLLSEVIEWSTERKTVDPK